MPQVRNLRPIFVFFVLALFTSVLCQAQGNAVIEGVQPEVGALSSVPEIDSCLEKKVVTLEEIKSIFGAKNVCGAACDSRLTPSCKTMCGDWAICFNGYCVYQ
jgi:hypothetical protein